MTSSTTPTVAVSEVMHYGIITASPDAPLAKVAGQLAHNRVHCVVVEGITRRIDGQETLVWGILSDLDLIKAFAADRVEALAGDEKLDERSPLPEIQHVIYIVKENRSYDQVLGDLKEGNGDPSLEIGRAHV